jgi:hypothetical protein
MGHAVYSTTLRSSRAISAGYYDKPRDEVFTQSRERKAHKEMLPLGIKFRESCDSAEHPNTVPIQLYLDVTGSMGHIPHEMIKDGLPTLVGTLTQNGVPDVALMFGAIGDHECDRAPLQVGQFESGDKELDMWLTRTWLEGNGGGNAGESYLLAWYFAGNHVRTDAFDKRKKKGFVFTVGDEPCLPTLPHSAVKELMGDTAVGQGNNTREQLLKKAQEQNHVYHIHVEHGGGRRNTGWHELLGQNLIVISDHTLVPKTISDIVLSFKDDFAGATSTGSNTADGKIML